MSKWRPNDKNCIYVIPDIHGNIELLKKICKRILPLRKSDGGMDRLILIGDLIDRHVDSHLVIDFCIQLEKEYGPQVIFLMGNHELMLLQALNIQPGKTMTLGGMSTMFDMWIVNGGALTLAGYMKRKGITASFGTLPRNRVLDILPPEHVQFFTKSLVKCYETNEFVFVHGGVNPMESASSQDLEILVWDRSLLKFVLNSIQTKTPLPWEKTVVCGHSCMPDKEPVITDKFMMLDSGAPERLLVVEVNSREACMAYPKKRLSKFELQNRESSSEMIRVGRKVA